jgi:MFS family permease
MSEGRKILNKHLSATCLIASLGGLHFGFDTAVLAGTIGSLTSVFHFSPLALGLTVSSALWGTVLGAAFAGRLGDIAGRRSCLRALGLLYVPASLGCSLAWEWYGPPGTVLLPPCKNRIAGVVPMGPCRSSLPQSISLRERRNH